MYPTPGDKDRVDRLMAVMAASGVYDELMEYFDSIANTNRHWPRRPH